MNNILVAFLQKQIDKAQKCLDKISKHPNVNYETYLNNILCNFSKKLPVTPIFIKTSISELQSVFKSDNFTISLKDLDKLIGYVTKIPLGKIKHIQKCVLTLTYLCDTLANYEIYYEISISPLSVIIHNPKNFMINSTEDLQLQIDFINKIVLVNGNKISLPNLFNTKNIKKKSNMLFKIVNLYNEY